MKIDKVEEHGVIAGTFSGHVGGYLGAAQGLKAGSFFFDTVVGGGDRSKAKDEGVPTGENGVTLSIRKLTVEGTGAPFYLRCGQNRSVALVESYGDYDKSPRVGFAVEGLYVDGIRTEFVISGLEQPGPDSGGGSQLRFAGFAVNRPEDSCKLTFKQLDAALFEASYEATLSLTKSDGVNVIEIFGSFRVPPQFAAP